MGKTRHEVRDGIHGFIEFNNLEKSLIDSTPFQRLRSIHQLAMTYQVYPGATHKRFEHSLGVMGIATRIFDRIFDRPLGEDVRERIADQLEPQVKQYWRSVLRIAALLHDVGHLPFSHAAEAQLLPKGWNHERLTAEIIRHSEIADLLNATRPKIDPEDVIDVAYSVKDRLETEPGFALDPWKTLLNEIITGNTFGADRIDYLLRDSWHAGVAYGRFDPDRLIDGLRLVIDPDTQDIVLALDNGGIHAAEALLLARYFMYTQVYFHDVRRVYDQHLQDFLVAWLPGGKFPTNWEELIKITDNEVLVAMSQALADPADPHYELAARVMKRQHFRTVNTLVTSNKIKKPTIFQDVLAFAHESWGVENVRSSAYGPKSETNNFLVLNDDGSVENSLLASGVIANLPPIEIGLIFVHPNFKIEAKSKIDAQLKVCYRRRLMEFRKHAFILEVINGLKAGGSWAGKTHVQKTLFLVNEATPVQVPFEFVLYKHGPYSFDIENELEQMKSYYAIAMMPVSSYGVVLKPSENADVMHFPGSHPGKKTASTKSAASSEAKALWNWNVSPLWSGFVTANKSPTAGSRSTHPCLETPHYYTGCRRSRPTCHHIAYIDAELKTAAPLASATLPQRRWLPKRNASMAKCSFRQGR